MLMDISGKDPTRIYRSIMFYRTKEAKGLNFLRKGKVTYVIEQEVIWICFSCEHDLVLRSWFFF
jgi:hypothetical protein